MYTIYLRNQSPKLDSSCFSVLAVTIHLTKNLANERTEIKIRWIGPRLLGTFDYWVSVSSLNITYNVFKIIKTRISTSNKEAKVLKCYVITNMIFFLMADMKRPLWYSKKFIYFVVEWNRIAASLVSIKFVISNLFNLCFSLPNEVN